MGTIDNEHQKEYIQVLKEWLKKQPHLPQNLGDLFLKRFLHCTNYSIEKAKSLIDLCFTIRSQAPEIFSNRDPQDHSIQSIIEISDMVPLSKFTQENYQVFIYRFVNPDPELFAYAESLKTFFMFSDLRMYTEPNCPDGEIPIFDMSGVSLRHLPKVSLSLLKKYMIYTQEAHPVKLKQIHIINTPAFLDKMMALVKPFLKAEVSKMIHFHSSDYSSLYNYIPKDVLPEEYGGKNGKVSDIKSHWVKRLMENRSLFLEESRWKLDESKRPEKDNPSKHFFGVDGSFKSLSID